MTTGGRVIRMGNVASRNLKSVLPIFVLAVYSIAIPPAALFGNSSLEPLKDGVALALVLAGLTLRAVVMGSFANGRGADELRDAGDLRTSGAYALSRNPLYLSGLLICIGIFLMHGSLPVVIIGTIGCLALYWLIVNAEERGLEARFGNEYRAYRDATPRWLPRPSGLARFRAGATFSVRRALANDWPVILVTVGALWLTEYYEYMPAHLAERSQLYLIGVSAIAASLIAFGVFIRTTSSSSTMTSDNTAQRSGPQTTGVLVEGRVRLVDFLENALSFGQLESILDETLKAAQLKPGERLVDVGCGSGKLVVDAARMLGNNGRGMMGIDATAGMIDLAHERAEREGIAADFQVGVAESLPLPDASVDAVTSSYFFHHLPSHVKPQALSEMWRVLKPGGRLVITDYSRARGVFGLIASFPMRFNFHEYVRPQLNGELEDIIAAENIGEPEILRLFLGYITVMRIVKPLEQ